MLSQYDLLIGGLKSQLDQLQSGISLTDDDLNIDNDEAENDAYTQCEVVMEHVEIAL